MSETIQDRIDQSQALIDEALEESTVRPDEPSLPPLEWMGKNLFGTGQGSTWAVVKGSLLTAFALLVGLLGFRSVLNFVFSENTRWDSVRVNLRLLFTQAYPDENYTRMWVTLGIVAALAGLSLGLMKVGQGFSLKRISLWAMSWGGLIFAGVMLREPSVLTDADGETIFADADGVELVRNELGSLAYPNGDPAPSTGLSVVRQSWGSAMGDRGGWWLLGLVLLAIGAALWFGLGDYRRRNTFVPAIPLALGGLGLLVSTTWWYRWGNYTFADGEYTFDSGARVASSTRIPWTIVFLILIAAYLFARLLQIRAATGAAPFNRLVITGAAVALPFLFHLVTFDELRPLSMLGLVLITAGFGSFALRAAANDQVGLVRAVVNGAWLLSPFVTFWVVLRGPVVDWGEIASVHFPLWLFFAVAGGALLWVMTRPGIGETGRLIAVAILAVAIFTWIAAFFGWFGMLQKIRLSILLLGLAGLIAPNFIGAAKQRMKLVYGWLGFITIFHILVTLMNTPSSIEVPTDFFAGGFMVTIYVSVFTIMFSFPLGVLLALARTSRLPLFRVMSTVYIESFRGVPLITMLFFFTVFINLFLPDGMSLSEFAAVTIAFSLFSAAYLAENVRGGLQAIRRGQYEASDALGLTTVQRTGFIVLPQALRVSIPPLVGQVLATFKETSLLAIVGVFDFLLIARNVIPNQTEFLGQQRPALLFISAVYFIGAYAMSKYSQRLEKQLGVGER